MEAQAAPKSCKVQVSKPGWSKILPQIRDLRKISKLNDTIFVSV